VRECGRKLTPKIRPGFQRKKPRDFVLGRQALENGVDEPQAHCALLINQFDSGRLNVIDSDLAVADDAVSCKLKPRHAEIDDGALSHGALT